MRLLLDTHVFLWACQDFDKLPAKAQAAMRRETNDLFLSAASLWEIAIKRALGRLSFPLEDVDQLLVAMGIEPIPITIDHAITAGGLPHHHDDPFDRMLVAQAQIEGLTLVTVDQKLPAYRVAILA